MNTKSEEPYLIDFWGGSHGHFLEYIVNCWIFRCPRVEKVFTNLGTSHGIRIDRDYQDSKKIYCAHFSQLDVDTVSTPEKIVRIIVDDFVGKCCYQLNIVHRAADIPKKHKELTLPAKIQQNPAALRMDYYSKLIHDNHGFPLPGQWRFQDLSVLEISMSSLYDFTSFLENLRLIANFLGFKFFPDPELFIVWKKFIDLNQGWNSWVLCNNILKDIIAVQDRKIDLEIDQQALLNALLTRTVDVYDGDLFSKNQYPDNTKDIYDILRNNLDINRF